MDFKLLWDSGKIEQYVQKDEEVYQRFKTILKSK